MKPTTDCELVTVYMGGLNELLPLRASLACRGFFTFLADETAFVTDPMMFSGGTFGCELKAPRSRAVETLEAIQELKRPSETTPQVRVDEAAAIEKLGRRIRWASLFTVSAPLALWLSFRYLLWTRRGLRSDDHRWVLAATALSVPMTCVLVTGVLALVINLITQSVSAHATVIVWLASQSIRVHG